MREDTWRVLLRADNSQQARAAKLRIIGLRALAITAMAAMIFAAAGVTEMAKKKKQGQIPGTEREEIEELSEAAEELRSAKSERADVTARIHDAQAHLDATVARLIENGDLKIADKYTIENEVVYRYEDEDGKLQDVFWSVKSKSGVKGVK